MTRAPLFRRTVLLLLCALTLVGPRASAQEGASFTVREAIHRALLNNRQLQIERINREVAYFTLKASYGIYDPAFQTEVRSDTASDTGGFDPADFNADAVFSADSEVVTGGLVGSLPTGLTYTLGGNFAHSEGTRNFLNFDSYRLGAGITLSQPLLRDFWIDQPRWLIRVNKKNLQVSELGVQYIAMSVANLTQQGYYDLVFAWDNLLVQRDLLEVRRRFLTGIQRQIELGSLTALEEKLAQSQVALAETDLVLAKSAVAFASNNLKTLLGVKGSEWTEDLLEPTELLVITPELFDLGESWRTGIKQRPDFLQLAINLERADLTVKYRKNQLFPTLDLIGSYGLKGSDAIQAFPPDKPKAMLSSAVEQIESRRAPNSMIGVLFSVPLTSASERANYKMSKELKRQAELLLKQKEELVLREVADAMDLARFSLERAGAARNAAQLAEESLKAEEQKLQGGAGSISFVLQAQTEAARAKIAELSARRDYNKALAQLYFTEGTLLERHQLGFEFH